jgi:uncharacterized surface protein with fasciclin (FAS1) repeats
MKNLLATVGEAGSCGTLLVAIEVAGLSMALQGPGPLTVFAPTDEAFARLPQGVMEALLADKDALTAVLLHHVIPGRLEAADVLDGGGYRPVPASGQSLSIRVDGGEVWVDDATVLVADVLASNGVVHVIDAVMLPKFAPLAAGVVH